MHYNLKGEGKWGKYIYIHTFLNLNKHLRSGVRIGSLGNDGVWCYFKHQKLLAFCHFCCHLEHALWNCKWNDDNNDTDESDLMYGDWLHACILKWGKIEK